MVDLENIDWESMVLGGVIGLVISVVIPIIIKTMWNRLIPKKLQDWFAFKFRKTQTKTPYIEEVSLTKAMDMILDYSQSRVTIIRIGDLFLNDREYKKRMEYIVEIDHIWDWHIFLKKNVGAQSDKWLLEFFDKESDDSYQVDTTNSTTNLICVSRGVFANNETIIELFTQYEIDTNFDDLIIYGVLNDVEEYPSFRDAISNHLHNFQFQGVVIFSDDGRHNCSVEFEKEKFIKKLLFTLADIEKYLTITDCVGRSYNHF